jgi:hypothetical protein
VTKKLEEFFNLPIKDTESEVDNEKIIDDMSELQTVMTGIDKIDQALPMVRNLETTEREMDHLANLAEEKFRELMDLGMNVEPRFSGVILQTASTLLGHAITARQAKIDKKLRMIDLQLKKARLDQTANKNQEDEPITGQGLVLDRTELIRQILESNKKTQ